MPSTLILLLLGLALLILFFGFVWDRYRKYLLHLVGVALLLYLLQLYTALMAPLLALALVIFVFWWVWRRIAR